MTWVATAIIGSAIIGGVTSSKAASTQARATQAATAAQTASTEKAIDAQALATEKSIAAQAAALEKSIASQERMFERQVALQEPFRQVGLTAQNRLADLLGISGRTGMAGYGYGLQPFTMAQYKEDPGYAFRLKRGIDAMERTAAARGGLLSGNQLRGVTEFGQDLASQEYQNAFNRFQSERSNILNPLQSLAGVGQTSTNALTSAAGNLGAGTASAYGQLGAGTASAYGQLGAGTASAYGQLGQNIGANLIGAGNARASGYMGAANAFTNALNQGLNYYQNQQLMANLFPQQGVNTLRPAVPAGVYNPNYLA